MRYVFFDIECANCFLGEGKICSFGYIITDIYFNILKKEDILINPDSRFYLRNKSKQFVIELAYPEKTFFSMPKFPMFYSKIKSLLQHENQVVIGHSILSDVSYLLSESKRYNLAPIDFSFCDTQEIHSIYSNTSGQIGLDKLLEKFGIDNMKFHKSDDDAEMTMLVTKAMCEKMNVSLFKLTQSFPQLNGEVRNGEILLNNGKHNITKFKLFKEYISTLRSPKTKKIANNYFKDKSFSFSSSLEHIMPQKIASIIEIILQNGGRYSKKASKANVFIRLDEPCNKLLELINYNENTEEEVVEIVTFNQFLQNANIILEDLEDFKFVAIDKVLVKKRTQNKDNRDKT